MKLLAVGDLHFKDNLSYAEYVKDGRTKEKRDVLDAIVKNSEDCDGVVFLGDQFHAKNNSSEVIREFVEFISKFKSDKPLYFLAGNHEKRGNGKTALDFIKEIGNPFWNVITTKHDLDWNSKRITLLPFLTKAELGTNDNAVATASIMSNLGGGDLLFHHFAVSDTDAASGISTNMFNEVVLPKKDLEKKYSWIIGGHIHTPKQYGATVVTGSIFTNEVGETDKYLWKIDTDDMKLEKIKLPGRSIHKLENPTVDKLSSIPTNDIIKVVVTDKALPIEEIKAQLKKFDAHIYVEQFPNERKKLHFDEGAIDFGIENLLKIYSQERSVDHKLLLAGFDLIK